MCNKRPIRANVFFVFLSVSIFFSLLLLLLYITIINIYMKCIFFFFFKTFFNVLTNKLTFDCVIHFTRNHMYIAKVTCT